MKYKQFISYMSCMALFLFFMAPQMAFADDASDVAMYESNADAAYEADDSFEEIAIAELPADEDEDSPNWHSGFWISGNVGPHVGSVFFIVGARTIGGLNAGLELGYHWRYFGIFAEQKILGNWVDDTDTIFTNASDKKDHDKLQGVMGGTNLLLKFFIPIADTCVLDLGIGAGIIYSREKFPQEDQSTGETKMAYEWFLLPAARAEFGFNWLLGQHLTLGFKIDVSYLVLWLTVEPSFTVGYNF